MKNKILSLVYVAGLYLILLCGFLGHVNASSGSQLKLISVSCQAALAPFSEEDLFYKEFATFLDLQNDFRSNSNHEELFPLYHSLHSWLRQSWISSKTTVIQEASGARLVLEITDVSDVAAKKVGRLADLKDLFSDGYRVVYDPAAFENPSSRILDKKDMEHKWGYVPIMEVKEDRRKKIDISEDYLIANYGRNRKAIELGAKMLMFSAQRGENSLYRVIVDNDHSDIFLFFKDLNNLKVLSEKLMKSRLSAKNYNRLKSILRSLYANNLSLISYMEHAKRVILHSPEKAQFLFENFEFHEKEDHFQYRMEEHPTALFDLGETDLHLGLLADQEKELLKAYVKKAKTLKDHKNGSYPMSVENKKALLNEVSDLKAPLIALTLNRLNVLLDVFSRSLDTLNSTNLTEEASQFKYSELLQLPKISSDLYQIFLDAEIEFLN